MEDTRAESLPIGAAEAAAALQTLQRYKAGKAALDKRLIDNELWFRMGHWKNYRDPLMPGKAQPSSGWLFNSIANKHADAMDNYPAPNVLPRAADDAQTAQVLSSILPVVLEQVDYEQVYSDTWWRKLKQGTGVKGVFWDPEARGGVGEIAIRPMNLLMLYWEPGVADIQASPHFFSLSMENTKQLERRWPQLKGHSASVLDVPRFLHDGGLDTTEKSVVVDWYYKKPDEAGRTLLHYCKFCNGVVLYASENDPVLAERGFYDHGKYPFVFDALFMEEDSPAGFGYIDVMKECQTAIDRMNHAMDENVLLASKQRYVLSDTAGVIATVDAGNGTSVEKDAKIATIYPNDAMQIKMVISEADLMDVTVGGKAEIEFNWDADSGRRFEGTISSISYLSEKQSDGAASQSAQYVAYVDFTPDETVRIGMTVIVYVE